MEESGHKARAMGRVVVVRVSDDSAAVRSAFVVAGGIGIDNPGGERTGRDWQDPPCEASRLTLGSDACAGTQSLHRHHRQSAR